MKHANPNGRTESLVGLSTAVLMLSSLIGDHWEVAYLHLGIGLAVILGLRSVRSLTHFQVCIGILIVLIGASAYVNRPIVDAIYMAKLYGVPGDIKATDNPLRDEFVWVTGFGLFAAYTLTALASLGWRQPNPRTGLVIGAAMVLVVAGLITLIDRTIIRPLERMEERAEIQKLSEVIGLEALDALKASNLKISVEGFQQFTAMRFMLETTTDPHIKAQFQEKLPHTINDYVLEVEYPGQVARAQKLSEPIGK